MKSHATMKSIGVIVMSVFLLWSTIAGEIIKGRFTSMTTFKCSSSVMCATSTPSKKLNVASKSMCTFECQRNRESCVGVNYEEIGKTLSCGLFSDNPTNYTKNVPGCQYIQRTRTLDAMCMEFGALVASVSGANNVTSAALHNGNVYAHIYGEQVMYEYSATPLQENRRFTWNFVGDQEYGLAGFGNIMYRADCFPTRSPYPPFELNQIDLTVCCDSRVTWALPAYPRGLSATSTGNVLSVTDNNMISEYAPGGQLVRQINDSNALWHAVEVTSSVWAVSRVGPVHGIALMSTNGTVIKSFTGSGSMRMNNPQGLAIDSKGRIFVADYNNGRILVVDPTLTEARQLQLPLSSRLQNPCCISIDESRGLMVVGAGNTVMLFNGFE